MKNIYDDMRKVANAVHPKFKQGTIVYVEMQPRTGGTPDDPLEPVQVTHTINALARPVSTKYVDGSIIVQSDKQISMPNAGVEPKMTGYVTIDAILHKIVQIMPRPAAGSPITYTLIVRR